MTGISLYKIADEYKFLMENLYNSETGEIDETVLASLNAMETSFQDKCINKVRFLKSIEYEAEAIEKERKAMQERERVLKKAVDTIYADLLFNMEKSDIKEISCPQFVIKLKKNPPSTDLYDVHLIPEEYQKVTISFDIQKIKDDIKSGINVLGARLIQTNSVSIK